MMVCREIPFAATLFHVRPKLTEWFQEREKKENEKKNEKKNEKNEKKEKKEKKEKEGGGVKETGMYFIRELGLGCLTSMITSPISHVPSVVAAYQQGHGVS